jgi:hypothetical protein
MGSNHRSNIMSRTKRLSLKSETLRPLSGSQLELVIGGIVDPKPTGQPAISSKVRTDLTSAATGLTKTFDPGKTLGDTVYRPGPKTLV